MGLASHWASLLSPPEQPARGWVLPLLWARRRRLRRGGRLGRGARTPATQAAVCSPLRGRLGFLAPLPLMTAGSGAWTIHVVLQLVLQIRSLLGILGLESRGWQGWAPSGEDLLPQLLPLLPPSAPGPFCLLSRAWQSESLSLCVTVLFSSASLCSSWGSGRRGWAACCSWGASQRRGRPVCPWSRGSVRGGAVQVLQWHLCAWLGLLT